AGPGHGDRVSGHVCSGNGRQLDQVILAAGTLDPNAVSQALQGFVTGERITLGVVAIGIQADLNSISDALEKLDTSDDGGGVATASKVAKTTGPVTATGVDAAGAVDEATPKEHPGHLPEARSVMSLRVRLFRTGPTVRRTARIRAGANDGAVTTANPSDSK